MNRRELIRDKRVVAVGNLNIDKDVGWIEKVRVYAAFRGKGYCNHLIKKIINSARRHKLKELILHVKYDNISAIKCYKNNDFKIVKKNFDKKKLFGYTMKLKL